MTLDQYNLIYAMLRSASVGQLNALCHALESDGEMLNRLITLEIESRPDSNPVDYRVTDSQGERLVLREYPAAFGLTAERGETFNPGLYLRVLAARRIEEHRRRNERGDGPVDPSHLAATF